VSLFDDDGMPAPGVVEQSMVEQLSRRKPVDLIAHILNDDSFALVHARSAAGLAWIRAHPCPWVVEDMFDHPLIVETDELEEAESASLIVWRVYSGPQV